MTSENLLLNIPVSYDPERIKNVPGNNAKFSDDMLMELIDEARSIANPKVFFKASPVNDRSRDRVVIDGFEFQSRVLSVNIEGLQQVFPYVATCGVEIETWSGSKTGIEKKLAQTLTGFSLEAAKSALRDYLLRRFNLSRAGNMSPGSIKYWPLEQQRPLFNLLGKTVNETGVALLENGFMTPANTTSGIMFSSDIEFASCMLCPMENCMGRTAPHDEYLYRLKYQ